MAVTILAITFSYYNLRVFISFLIVLLEMIIDDYIKSNFVFKSYLKLPILMLCLFYHHFCVPNSFLLHEKGDLVRMLA